MKTTLRLICRSKTFRKSLPLHRKGSVLVIATVIIVMLLAMAMFSIDVAYMQLTRSELRAASDAAAKAGAESLRRTQSVAVARQAAIDIAAKNEVGGKPMTLIDSNVEIGTSVLQPDGHWGFVANQTPFNTVKVVPEFGNGKPNPAINLFFADLFGTSTFAPTQTSIAASTQTEICLAVDRSHSMCFDLSGVDWSYPPGTPMSPHPIAYPPHPTKSRWGVLRKAIMDFELELKKQNPRPRVALVTWGSEITLANYEGWLTRQTSPEVTTDVELTLNHGQIVSSINARGNNVILGGTKMSAGIDRARSVLNGSNVRPGAKRIMVLMTDGQWNQGRDPVLAAQDAHSEGIIIHTITFLPGAEQSTMEQVATITGGRHFHADNESELRFIFEDLARSLPVVLTE
ncbi:MAG: VWA domain-containing protein [Planctomycetaceae bacterium]